MFSSDLILGKPETVEWTFKIPEFSEREAEILKNECNFAVIFSVHALLDSQSSFQKVPRFSEVLGLIVSITEPQERF